MEIEASGTVEPVDRVKISPKISGRLVKLGVEQGVKVKKGQVLAVMDNNEIQARGVEAQARQQQAIANLKEAETRIPGEINQAKARVMQAQARLKETQESLPKEINQAEAQVFAAESRLKLALERVKRFEYLQKQGAETKDRFDEAVNEFNNAQASLGEAKQRLEQSKKTAQPEIDQLGAALVEAQVALAQKEKSAQAEIDQLKAAIGVAQAQLKTVEIQFSDTILRAAF